MPFNGSGSYTPPAASFPYVAATLIESAKVNAVINDIATALTTAVTKDGQTTITANLPMAGFRHTGVGDGVARSDYAAMGQAQDGTVNWVVAGGTADALTATYVPTITALVDGQLCFVRAASANATTTPTFAPNGLTAHTITKLGGVAIVAGEWATDQELILRYKLASTRWELLNPTIVNGVKANGIVTASITDAAVATAKIADANVTTAKIADSNVTNAKLANSAITIFGVSTSLGGTASASQITNSLGSDVSLTNTATYFDGPSIAQGSTGTWFVSGTVTLIDTNGASGLFAVKLWDGTTVVASADTRGDATSGLATVSLSGYLATPAGNLRLSVKNSSNTTNTAIKFNLSGSSKDSTISAFRIG